MIQGIEEQNVIKIESVANFRYPVGTDSDDIFSDYNIARLVQFIKEYKLKKYTQNNILIRIALPFSYAIIKRIAIPLTEDKAVLFSQVKWDLNNYLPGDPNNYKVVKTDIVFEYPQYQELVFVAISKNIIRQLMKMTEQCGDVLDELVLDVFCLERYLRFNNLLDFSAIQVLMKTDQNHIAIHVYLEGKYYTSFIDPLNHHLPNFSYIDKIIELSKDRIKQIDNLIAQIGYDQSYTRQYFVYGSGLQDHLFEQFNQAFNKPLYRLPAVDHSQSGDNSEVGSLETLGIMNIRTKL